MAVPKPILCLDFDGVIHQCSSGWHGARNIPDEPVPGAFAFMAAALGDGWDVVIHSGRARHWGGISAMRRWLKFHAGKLYYDSPACPGLRRVRFSRTKPPARVVFDDRAIPFIGVWPTFRYLREFQPWHRATWSMRD